MFRLLVCLIFNIYLFVIYSHQCDLYVQLSAASKNYIIYLPIVAKAWKRIGCCTIVVIIYHYLSNEILFIKRELLVLNSEVLLIKYNNSVSLHYASKLARIFGYLYNRKAKYTAIYYISDADILPLSNIYFHVIKNNKLNIKSFGKSGYGFGNNRGRWAMCYMAANKYIWNDLLKDDIKYDHVKEIISKIITTLVNKGEKYFDGYEYMDEVYMRDKIKNWKFFKSKVQYYERNYLNSRIGRNSMYTTEIINNSKMIDIHLPKLNKDIIYVWKNKIIPLQKYLFKYIPYDMKFLSSFISLK